MQKASTYYRRRFNPSQRGFTMIEMLVAMAIGLFLIAGVFQIFVANKQSSRIQNNLSHLQENGRYAIIQIGRTLRMTGFKADPTDTTSFVTGAATGTNGTGLGGSDTLSISFQADGLMPDCLGTTFPAASPPTLITNQLYLATDTNGVSNLYCKQTTVPASVPAEVALPLVEDVTDMQITYGVDINNTGAANYYVDSTAVSAADWSKVVSIHITVLVVSQEDNITTAAQTYRYDGVAVTASDKRLHKVFSTTIALRNRLI